MQEQATIAYTPMLCPSRGSNNSSQQINAGIYHQNITLRFRHDLDRLAER